MTEVQPGSAAEAQTPYTGRLRGISSADALAVTFISAMLAAFIGLHGLLSYVLIGSMAVIYAAFRSTRGLPARQRIIAVAAALTVSMTLASALAQSGY